MAALLPSRTRSMRIAANTARPLQPPASSSGTSNATVSASGHAGVSSLSLFLTNIRLLDLDLLPDWPGIVAETFVATGTSAQGQKKRVQSVEWALFRLFMLWDPEHTKKNLQPFFPPLDQVQSISLRAALLRALEQAKKAGVLGRDAILRKTMLDECKGERLEEVLASFSAAVVKQVVADGIVATGEPSPVAIRLALENRGYNEERSDLVALALAHRASLQRLLKGKKATNARYQDFADLLNIKDRGIARRSEQIRAREGSDTSKTLSNDARLEMRRAVRNNWAGNERWMETLLSGDAGATKEGLLATPFDRVWRRVQQGRLAELEESGSGLLDQLDIRVRTQRERLQRWEAFRKSNFGDRSRSSPTKSKVARQATTGIDLGFGAHEELQAGRMSPTKPTFASRQPGMNDAYADLVQGLQKELNALDQKRTNPLEFLKAWESEDERFEDLLSAEADPEEAISELSEQEDDDHVDTFPTQAPIKSFQAKLQGAKRLPIRPHISHTYDGASDQDSSSLGIRAPESRRGDSKIAQQAAVVKTQTEEVSAKLPDDGTLRRRVQPPNPLQVKGYDMEPVKRTGGDYRAQEAVLVVSPPVVAEDNAFSHRSPTRFPSRDRPTPSYPAAAKEDIVSPTQDLANQVLNTIDSTSPSPTKSSKPRHTLSLAERTRLSMARGHSALFSEDEPELPLGPVIANASAPTLEDDNKMSLIDEEHEDLASRTRKSMAGFEKARQKAQMERRRSIRRSKLPPRKEGSYFPKVDEEAEESMLVEELGEDDMEAVFMSRPKIKASPIPSPTREWDDE